MVAQKLSSECSDFNSTPRDSSNSAEAITVVVDSLQPTTTGISNILVTSAVYGSEVSDDYVIPTATEILVREKRFWITVIATVFCLNTLLVSVLVIIGFCVFGDCGGRKTDSADDTVYSLQEKTKPPFLSPLDHKTVSYTGGGVPGKIDRCKPGDQLCILLESFESEITLNMTMDETTSSSNKTTAVVESSMQIPGDDATSSLLVGVYVGVAIVVEVLVMIGVYWYYRRWKRQTQVLSSVTATKQEETNNTEQEDGEKENNDDFVDNSKAVLDSAAKNNNHFDNDNVDGLEASDDVKSMVYDLNYEGDDSDEVDSWEPNCNTAECVIEELAGQGNDFWRDQRKLEEALHR